jgi:hypothetical protein
MSRGKPIIITRGFHPLEASAVYLLANAIAFIHDKCPAL